MKRKVKRFNGGSGSSVNYEPLSDEDKQLLDVTLKEMRGDVGKSSQDEDDSGISSSYMPRSTFKQEAIGDATNDNIRVRKYTPRKKSVAPKKASLKSKEVSTEDSIEPVEYKSTPVKTSKQKIEEIKSETPLQNRQGGFHLLNAMDRIQRVGSEAMKESARQARVDRIRRNVGSNLETYGMKKGGKVSSASSRADGIAQRGKTRGKLR